MPKFVFTCEHKDLWSNNQVCKNTHEFEIETLDKVLENFEMFLRGAGYVFNGVVDIVPVDEDDIQHSEHYYDVDRNIDPTLMNHEWEQTIRGENG